MALVNKDSPYGNSIIYKCYVSDDIINQLRTKGELEIELLSKYEKKYAMTKIYDYGLDFPKEKYLFVESVNHIFFEKVNINLIYSIIPWIEYHLSKGVDQHNPK